jgi:hypothetical protein
MGEEKPDEELMGKRKSSPRLSTASSDADDFILSALWAIIHFTPKKILGPSVLRFRCLYNPRESVVR